ncbi:MAG: iron-containing alcohol dehydrogenase family protein [Firmicutes bacterium]|nr:iron-containing alcohol dehydrogenase family protein [Bacillota bacterium]
MLKRTIGPPVYQRGYGTLALTGEIAATLGQRILIAGGQTALSVTRSDLVTSLENKGLDVVTVEWYGGQCSWSNIHTLSAKAIAAQAQCLVAVGGGRALDTIKAAAFASQLPVITVPTIAATCAAWTPLAAIYDDHGEYLEFSRKAALPSAVLVDTKIIAEAPVRYLVSGLGDTLAKWYELAASTRGRQLAAPVQAGLRLGKLCKDIIIAAGPSAYQSVTKSEASTSLDQAVDTIIAIAGCVSGLGGDEARTAAAHAIYSGLTAMEAVHQMVHGEIVGFGILAQLALENRPEDEVEEFLTLSDQIGLPITLHQLGINHLARTDWQRIASLSMEVEDMAAMPFPVTEAMVIQAIQQADAWGQAFRGRDHLA